MALSSHSLPAHHGSIHSFCGPGIDGAHEEGGVEGEVGRFRRRHFGSGPAGWLAGSSQRGDRGRRLAVRLTATTVEVLDGSTLLVCHERAIGRHVEVLALDHYLEVLETKPGGLPGVLSDL